MDIDIRPVRDEEMVAFKDRMRNAFDAGARQTGWSLPEGETVLPFEDIDRSLAVDGADALQILCDDVLAGGAIVTGNDQKRELDFLFIDTDAQNKHIGQQAWCAIERRYPKTMLWETCTPYDDIRNVYFYVNRCGFVITRLVQDKEYPPSAYTETEDTRVPWMVSLYKRIV